MPNAQQKFLLQQKAYYHSGPLPDPAALEQYGLINSSFPERIVRMAETQHEHRIDLEAHVVKRNQTDQRIGIFCAFFICLGLLGLGGWLLHQSNNIGGIGTIVATLGAFAYVFKIGKSRQLAELSEKRSHTS